MNLVQFIENLFQNETILDEKNVIKEINGMKNSQPPEKPTFIINQNDTKNRLVQKLTDCMYGRGFEHIVLTGKVGGGKTHFLNWIESRMSENGQFYMVKFRVQETSNVKYSFIKMIVSKIFQQYFEDFTYAINSLAKDFKEVLHKGQDQVESVLCQKYNITNDLARLLYSVCAETNKKNAAIRIMGASNGRTELVKLGIKNLTDSDYIKIVQFFLYYKKKEGYLLILLDEFEHAYLSLTPAARRNFFTSYKDFINDVVTFDPASLVLITSVTEQYEGHLQEKVGSMEQALWSRIQHHVNALNEFSPADNNEFKELFNELSIRYKIAYNYDIYAKNDSEMRKRFLERLGGDTAQPISYRDAILNMLGIMDDLRMNKQTLEVSKGTRLEYEKIIQEVQEQWNNAHHNAKTGIIKSSLERILIDLGYTKLDLRDELGSVLFVSNSVHKKLLYISTVSNSKGLASSINKCIKYKDELSYIEGGFKTIFLYQKQWETKAIIQMLDFHPDIYGLAITDVELYNLFGYKNVHEKVSKEKITIELERIINELR